jgi:hypothetical protein
VSNGQLGFEPELGLAFNVLNVHVSPEFLAGEEEEPIPANPENRGTHNPRIPEIHMRRIGQASGGCEQARGRAGSAHPRPAARACRARTRSTRAVVSDLGYFTNSKSPGFHDLSNQGSSGP